ncbi:MAG: hypothetical protein MMC23_007947 [Stictis urceolatum]|nr:hypothetical protein [Stictis urceolata]
MSSDNSPPQSPSQRRASFAPGAKLSEMFGRTPGSNGVFPGPIAAAAANASAHQKRRMSISTLGLSGSPNQTSPFNSNRQRQESYSSTSTSPGDNESAIDDSADGPPSAGSSPFARRMSFGARAMRDARGGQAGSYNGRASSVSANSTAASPPSSATAAARKASGPSRGVGAVEEEPSEPQPHAHSHPFSKSHSYSKSHSKSPSNPSNPFKESSNPFIRRAGEGFSWSDQLRSRAERSASITSPANAGMNPAGGLGGGMNHTRANTVAVAEQPVKEMPKQPKAPDHFQERILKGDFYMD